MGNKWLYLVVAGGLGVSVGLVPSLAAGDAAPMNGSFTAVDYSWNAAGGGHQVTIAQGGAVSFGYPTGFSAHNADFGGGPQPTSCHQTAGPSSGTVPPVPHRPTSAGWTGTCTFNTAGTYTFHCDLHPFMTGTIVVEGPGGTTTGNPPPTTTGQPPSTPTQPPSPPTPPPSTPTTTQATPSPPAATAAVSLGHRQHGHKIAGSVQVPAGYAGGSLEVDVLASARALGLRPHGNVRLGRLLRRALADGRERFAVSLHGLRGHRRLRLTVQVRVTSPQGASSSARFSVLLTP